MSTYLPMPASVSTYDDDHIMVPSYASVYSANEVEVVS